MDARFLLIISIFTGVAAVALLIQMAMMIGLFISIRSAQKRVMSLADRVEPILDTSRRLLEETRQHARDIFGKLQDITETTRTQVMRIDELMIEVSAHTRATLERLDDLVVDAAARAQETMDQVQRTILAPVRGLNGAAAAVRAVVNHLARRRASSDRVTQEEDLFI
jgi:uncharacterized protein YoxC